MQVELVSSSWLRRKFRVSVDRTEYSVEYFGRGMGWEGVAVNGQFVAGGTSMPWFIPGFSFHLGSQQAHIAVRVWPWLTLRSLRFTIAGTVVYTEPR